MRGKWWAPAGLAAVALVIAACGSSSTSSTPAASNAAPASSAQAASGSALKTASVSGATVLTNAQGFTLYWFVPDTPTKSNCNGSCATFWPPVKGPATAGAGFALATLGGYLLSLWFGLFGFREVRTTAGIVAGVIEVATVATLGVLALTPPPGTLRVRVPHPGWLAGGVAVAALAVLAGSVASAAGSGSTVSAGGSLHTTRLGGTTVLVSAKGFTLYWFAPDTPTTSNCNGSCAAYWPPVKGPVTAAG